MKVAMVVPGGVDRSGTRRVIPVLLALIRRLARRHELHVFSLFQEDTPGNWDLLGARVHNIGRTRTALRGLRAIVSEHRRGGFDVLHAIWASPSGTLAVLAGRFLRRPVVVHLAGGELVSLPALGYGEQRTPAGRLRVRVATAGAACITAPSRSLVELAARAGIRAERLPLGIDPDVWPPVPPRPREPGRPLRLIHVASLNAVKDPGTLLAAAAVLRDRGIGFTLDIVGEDAIAGAAQRRTTDLGLSDVVTFHGFLEQPPLRARVLRAEVLVMTSRFESGPAVLAEAAACGVPTVGTRVGMIADWAPDAALAVPAGDPAAVAEAIGRLATDDGLRMGIAVTAQLRASTEDADWSADRVEDVYRRVGER